MKSPVLEMARLPLESVFVAIVLFCFKDNYLFKKNVLSLHKICEFN